MEIKARPPFHVVFDESGEQIEVSYPSLETGERTITLFSKSEKDRAVRSAHDKVELLALVGPTQLFIGKDRERDQAAWNAIERGLQSLFDFGWTPERGRFAEMRRGPRGGEVAIFPQVLAFFREIGVDVSACERFVV